MTMMSSQTRRSATGASAATLAKDPQPKNDAWEAIRASHTTRQQTFAAHDVIYFEGDDAKNLYEIISGAAMLYKLLPDGRR